MAVSKSTEHFARSPHHPLRVPAEVLGRKVPPIHWIDGFGFSVLCVNPALTKLYKPVSPKIQNRLLLACRSCWFYLSIFQLLTYLRTCCGCNFHRPPSIAVRIIILSNNITSIPPTFANRISCPSGASPKSAFQAVWVKISDSPGGTIDWLILQVFSAIIQLWWSNFMVLWSY